MWLISLLGHVWGVTFLLHGKPFITIDYYGCYNKAFVCFIIITINCSNKRKAEGGLLARQT